MDTKRAKNTAPAAPSAFDFGKEVARVLKDYPHLRKTVLFVQTSDYTSHDAPLKTYGFLQARHAFEKLDKETRTWLLDSVREAKMKDAPHYVVHSNRAHITHQEGLKLIILPLDGTKMERDLGFDELFVKFFMLDHELGHVLIGADHFLSDVHVYNECAADAFATIRSLQRFGNNQEELLYYSKLFRAGRTTLYSRLNHLTTPVIDKIIEDSRHRDFSKLTPLGTARLAKQYAKKYTPSAKEMMILKRSYRRVRKKNRYLPPEL